MSFLHKPLYLRNLLLILLLISLLTIYYTCPIVVTHYTISSSKLPSSFDQYRILQLSDVHIDSNEYDNTLLLKKIKLKKPDLIVITGDLISSSSYAFEPCLDLLKQLAKLAPTYYIYGNHEVYMTYNPTEAQFLSRISQLGVTLLNNETTQITAPNGESFTLVGLMDPIDVNMLPEGDSLENLYLQDSLTTLTSLNEQDFNLLLAHRPEYINQYSDYHIDLVLAGHAHGGLVRLPLIGGLYATNQGFFPKYTSGVHRMNHTKLIINRGIGVSSVHLRIFNPPEIVVVTLKSTHK